MAHITRNDELGTGSRCWRWYASHVLLLLLLALPAAPTGVVKIERISPPPLDLNVALATRAISADGRFVAFYSDADNLVPGDDNRCMDVFVAERG